MNIKNKKLKIAIAGLGFGKKVHLEALKESDYLTPVAIYHYEKKTKIDLRKRNRLRFFS
jgi:predicted dehydrogenase